VYREHSYHGFVYHRFVPTLYYGPVFYQWVYNPWPAPIYFTWGWNADPWYGYYGAYFTPAPIYTSPALWLTDYLLAENLKLAYENQQENGEPAPAPSVGRTVALSPDARWPGTVPAVYCYYQPLCCAVALLRLSMKVDG
jgi:hypothetical protein